MALGLLAISESSSACEAFSLLECIPKSDRDRCGSFVDNWGSADTESSLRIVQKEYLHQGMQLASGGKLMASGFPVDAVVYGCYSRKAYESLGESAESHRLMFVMLRSSPTPSIVIFPESNPSWDRGDPLIHYRILGVRRFVGPPDEVGGIAHILFVERKEGLENPCCDGGGPSPISRVLLGFMLKPDSVTKVFHHTIEETLNSRLLNGEGAYSVLTSTISYLALENKIQLETSHIQRVYPSSVDKGSRKWIERPPLSTVEKKTVELFIWDGKGFLKHTM